MKNSKKGLCLFLLGMLLVLSTVVFGVADDIENQVQVENELAVLAVEPDVCVSVMGACEQSVVFVNKQNKEVTWNYEFGFDQYVKSAGVFLKEWLPSKNVRTPRCWAVGNISVCAEDWVVQKSASWWRPVLVQHRDYFKPRWEQFIDVNETVWLEVPSLADAKKKVLRRVTQRVTRKNPLPPPVGNAEGFGGVVSVPAKSVRIFRLNYATERGQVGKWSVKVWTGSKNNPSWSLLLDPWYNGDLEFKREVVITQNGTTALTDFPVPVNGTAPSKFNNAVLWARVASLSPGGSLLYGYYSNDSYAEITNAAEEYREPVDAELNQTLSAYNSSQLWELANASEVFHMGNSSADSSLLDGNMTVSYHQLSANGTCRFGECRNINGSGPTGINASPISYVGDNTFTGWARSDSNSTSGLYQSLVFYDNNAGTARMYFLYPSGYVADNNIRLNCGGVPGDYTLNPGQINKWTHYAITYNATSGDCVLFVDGGRKGLVDGPGAVGGNVSRNLVIGNKYVADWATPSTEVWQGQIDEVRMYQQIKSDDWIAAESNYNNSVVGNQQALAGPPTPGLAWNSTNSPNALSTTVRNVTINITVENASALQTFNFTWNGTEYNEYNDSLILGWDFDSVDSIGDTATKVTDISGHGYNLTLDNAGANIVSEGVYGSSLQLIPADEFSNYAYLPADTKFSNTSTTLMWWLRQRSDSTLALNHYTFFYMSEDYTASHLSGLQSSNNNTRFTNYYGDTFENQFGSTRLPYEWHHLALVYNRSANTTVLYVDGSVQFNITNSPGYEINTTFRYLGHIGGWGYVGAHLMYDEVRLYNRSFSESEVRNAMMSTLRKIDNNTYVYENKLFDALPQTGTYTYSAIGSNTDGTSSNNLSRSITFEALPPNVSYVANTPMNNTQTTNPSFTINISVGNATYAGYLNYTWNYTNRTNLYDPSLVAHWSFGNTTMGSNNSEWRSITPNKIRLFDVQRQNGLQQGGYGGYFWNSTRTSYLSTDVDFRLWNSNGYTISFWANLDYQINSTGNITLPYNVSLANRVLKSNHIASPLLLSDSLYFGVDSVLTRQVNNYTGSATCAWPCGVSIGQWTHYAVTNNGTRAVTYVNGVERINQVSGSENQSYPQLRFGMTAPQGSRFNGSFDEIYYWNRALNDSEVQKNMFTTWYLAGLDDWRIQITEHNLSVGKYNYTVSGASLSNHTTANASRQQQYEVINLSLANWTVTWFEPEWELNSTNLLLNITNGQRNITSLNVTLWYNGTNITSGFGFANSSAPPYHTSVISRNVTAPLVQVNGTVVPFNWTYSVGYNDGGSEQFTSTNTSNQTIVWSFFPTGASPRSPGGIETDVVNFTANVSVLSSASLNLTLNFTINTTNLQASWGTNVSGIRRVEFSALNATELLTGDDSVTNITYTTVARLRVNNSWERNFTGANLTLSRMILTNCSDESVTQNISLQYEAFEENNFTTRASTNWQENYKVWNTDNTKYRIYSWLREDLNNVTTCLYPRNTSTQLTVVETLDVGDGVVWAVRNYNNQGVLNHTARNASIYLLAVNDSAVSYVTINIQNTKAIAQPDKLIQVWRYYLVGNNEVKVSQEITDVDGKIRTPLRLQDAYYRFVVYNRNGTDLQFNSSLMRIFGTSLTFAIGASTPKGWEVYFALGAGDTNLTFTNNTKTFTMAYDYASIQPGNYSITNYCLNIRYFANTTNVPMDYSLTCSANSNGVINAVIDDTIADRWSATSFVNVTAGSQTNFTTATSGINLAKNLGVEAIWWSAIMYVVIVASAVWSPMAALLVSVGFMVFLTASGFVTLSLSGGAITAIFIMSFVGIWFLRN